MRRILIYIEPVTERSDPQMKRPWLGFAARIAESIFDAEPEAQISCIVGDGIAPFVTEHPSLTSVRVIEVAHQELIPRFAASGLDLMIAWYRDERNELRDGFADFLRSKLDGTDPDICITFSPAPFLATLFPQAEIFHFELGAVSRPPFPMTAYLDRDGMFRTGFPCRHPDIPLAFDEVPSLEAIDEIADQHRRWVAEFNPFAAVIEQLELHSRPSVLVALQHAEHYAFAVHSEYASQFDLLLAVLDNAPADCAVIVTEHPNFPVLASGAIDALKRRYRNFVFEPAFRSVPAASYYLTPAATAVITVDSSVGLQALFWGKRLITPLRSSLAPFASGTDISKLPELLVGPHDPDRGRRVVAWHLTRYAMPFDVLFSGGCLLGWMDGLARDAGTEDAYRRSPASLARIVSSYRAALAQSSRSLPVPATASKGLDARFAQLFIDRGKGFSEDDCLSLAWIGAGTQRLRFPLREASTVSRLRFDPINDYCVAKLFSAEIVTTDGTRVDILDRASYPGASRSLGGLSYPTVDPQVVFDFGAVPDAATFEVEMQLLEFGAPALAFIASQIQNSVQHGIALSADSDGNPADRVLAELKGLRSDVDGLRALSVEIGRLESRLENQRAVEHRLLAEIDRARDEGQSRLDGERRAAARALAELQNRHDEALASSQGRLEELRQQLKLQSRAAGESQHLLAAARNENETLASRLDDLTPRLETAERAAAEARASLQRELAAAAEQFASLERRAAQLTARIEALECENGGLRAERGRLASQVDDLEADAQAVRRQRDEERRLIEQQSRELEHSQRKRQQAIGLLQKAFHKRTDAVQQAHATRNNDSKLTNQ